MRRWLTLLGMIAALLFLVFTLVNASWLAPETKGAPKLIAHRALAQLPVASGAESPCPASRIEPPIHPYLANSVPAIVRAAKLGAYLVEIDPIATRDDRLALLGEPRLDCLTDGAGTASDATLAQLQALDVGHGYTADGGESFPLRGKGTGAIPALEDAFPAISALGRGKLLYRLSGEDPREVALLIAAIRAAERDVAARGDAFYGAAQPIARIRAAFPEAWAFNPDEAEACKNEYIALGWSGYVPASCRGATIVVPLDRQWAFWGWPNRMLDRMEQHGTRVVVTAPQDGGEQWRGLDLPEQLGRIPASFNGFVWVDDSLAVIPAFIQRFDDRTREEVEAVVAGLERRRTRGD